MPLLDDNLSIWEIGFRWSGIDPGSILFRIKSLPTAVKDTIRLVLRAILDGDLYCSSLPINPKKEPMLSEWYEQQRKIVEEVLDEGKYNRKFLKLHGVHRWEFAQWCDKCGIPYPEFWFPPGWKTNEPGYPEALRLSPRNENEPISSDEPSSILKNTETAVPKSRSKMAEEFAIQFAIKARNASPLIKNPEIIHALQKNKGFLAFKNPAYSYKHLLGWIRHLDPKLDERKKRTSSPGKSSEMNSDPLRQLERNQMKRNK